MSAFSAPRATTAPDAPARAGAEDAREADVPAPKTSVQRFREKLSETRRSRTKSKADKTFMRQYGGSDSSAADAPAGPRAAVYKGEMGTQHRKAARMQNDPAPQRSRQGASPKREKAASPLMIGFAALATCVLFSCVFLYGPAQQYYQQIRERDRLEAEYAVIQERNDTIQSVVDSLSTAAGVEDRARTEFGWAKSDEEVASVSGVHAEDGSTFTASIVPGTVKAPDTWYSGLLDPLFGVK